MVVPDMWKAACLPRYIQTPIASPFLVPHKSFLYEESQITINNYRHISLIKKGTIPKGLAGIVWQDDLLLSNLTVRETIAFAAKLKMPQ
jgi:hypothetical protein